MNLALDTHALLWWLDDSPLLGEKARQTIADPANIIVLSAVVIWEIRIKEALGKLTISREFYEIAGSQGFEWLSISPRHANAVGDLPMHHRDPFDRMLITQARMEGLTVVTRDAVFEKYDVPVLRC